MHSQKIFRGRAVNNGEFVFGYYWKGCNNIHYIKTLIWNDYGQTLIDCIVIPETVGGFTGLPDKKGDSIFEGDKTTLGIVTYRPNYCDYVFINEKYGNRVLNVTKANITKYNVEINGNIYD